MDEYPIGIVEIISRNNLFEVFRSITSHFKRPLKRRLCWMLKITSLLFRLGMNLFSAFHAPCRALDQLPALAQDDHLGCQQPGEENSEHPGHDIQYIRQVGGQAVLGRQNILPTPWLTERHGYDPTYEFVQRFPCALPCPGSAPSPGSG